MARQPSRRPGPAHHLYCLRIGPLERAIHVRPRKVVGQAVDADPLCSSVGERASEWPSEAGRRQPLHGTLHVEQRARPPAARTGDGVKGVPQPLALRLFSRVHDAAGHLQTGAQAGVQARVGRGREGWSHLHASNSALQPRSPCSRAHFVVQAAAGRVNQEDPHAWPPLLQVVRDAGDRAARARP